jgi:23S rRNA A2030 N6-methylase RlmJ
MESTKESKKQFNFGDYVLWFPKGNKSQLEKFIRKWFRLYIV